MASIDSEIGVNSSAEEAVDSDSAYGTESQFSPRSEQGLDSSLDTSPETVHVNKSLVLPDSQDTVSNVPDQDDSMDVLEARGIHTKTTFLETFTLISEPVASRDTLKYHTEVKKMEGIQSDKLNEMSEGKILSDMDTDQRKITGNDAKTMAGQVNVNIEESLLTENELKERYGEWDHLERHRDGECVRTLGEQDGTKSQYLEEITTNNTDGSGEIQGQKIQIKTEEDKLKDEKHILQEYLSDVSALSVNTKRNEKSQSQYGAVETECKSLYSEESLLHRNEEGMIIGNVRMEDGGSYIDTKTMGSQTQIEQSRDSKEMQIISQSAREKCKLLCETDKSKNVKVASDETSSDGTKPEQNLDKTDKNFEKSSECISESTPHRHVNSRKLDSHSQDNISSTSQQQMEYSYDWRDESKSKVSQKTMGSSGYKLERPSASSTHNFEEMSTSFSDCVSEESAHSEGTSLTYEVDLEFFNARHAKTKEESLSVKGEIDDQLIQSHCGMVVSTSHTAKQELPDTGHPVLATTGGSSISPAESTQSGEVVSQSEPAPTSSSNRNVTEVTSILKKRSADDNTGGSLLKAMKFTRAVDIRPGKSKDNKSKKKVHFESAKPELFEYLGEADAIILHQPTGPAPLTAIDEIDAYDMEADKGDSSCSSTDTDSSDTCEEGEEYIVNENEHTTDMHCQEEMDYENICKEHITDLLAEKNKVQDSGNLGGNGSTQETAIKSQQPVCLSLAEACKGSIRLSAVIDSSEKDKSDERLENKTGVLISEQQKWHGMEEYSQSPVQPGPVDISLLDNAEVSGCGESGIQTGIEEAVNPLAGLREVAPYTLTGSTGQLDNNIVQNTQSASTDVKPDNIPTHDTGGLAQCLDADRQGILVSIETDSSASKQHQHSFGEGVSEHAQPRPPFAEPTPSEASYNRPSGKEGDTAHLGDLILTGAELQSINKDGKTEGQLTRLEGNSSLSIGEGESLIIEGEQCSETQSGSNSVISGKLTVSTQLQSACSPNSDSTGDTHFGQAGGETFETLTDPPADNVSNVFGYDAQFRSGHSCVTAYVFESTTDQDLSPCKSAQELETVESHHTHTGRDRSFIRPLSLGTNQVPELSQFSSQLINNKAQNADELQDISESNLLTSDVKVPCAVKTDNLDVDLPESTDSITVNVSVGEGQKTYSSGDINETDQINFDISQDKMEADKPQLTEDESDIEALVVANNMTESDWVESETENSLPTPKVAREPISDNLAIQEEVAETEGGIAEGNVVIAREIEKQDAEDGLGSHHMQTKPNLSSEYVERNTEKVGRETDSEKDKSQQEVDRGHAMDKDAQGDSSDSPLGEILDSGMVMVYDEPKQECQLFMESDEQVTQSQTEIFEPEGQVVEGSVTGTSVDPVTDTLPTQEAETHTSQQKHTTSDILSPLPEVSQDAMGQGQTAENCVTMESDGAAIKVPTDNKDAEIVDIQEQKIDSILDISNEQKLEDMESGGLELEALIEPPPIVQPPPTFEEGSVSSPVGGMLPSGLIIVDNSDIQPAGEFDKLSSSTQVQQKHEIGQSVSEMQTETLDTGAPDRKSPATDSDTRPKAEAELVPNLSHESSHTKKPETQEEKLSVHEGPNGSPDLHLIEEEIRIPGSHPDVPQHALGLTSGDDKGQMGDIPQPIAVTDMNNEPDLRAVEPQNENPTAEMMESGFVIIDDQSDPLNKPVEMESSQSEQSEESDSELQGAEARIDYTDDDIEDGFIMVEDEDLSSNIFDSQLPPRSLSTSLEDEVFPVVESETDLEVAAILEFGRVFDKTTVLVEKETAKLSPEKSLPLEAGSMQQNQPGEALTPSAEVLIAPDEVPTAPAEVPTAPTDTLNPPSDDILAGFDSIPFPQPSTEAENSCNYTENESLQPPPAFQNDSFDIVDAKHDIYTEIIQEQDRDTPLLPGPFEQEIGQEQRNDLGLPCEQESPEQLVSSLQQQDMSEAPYLEEIEIKDSEITNQEPDMENGSLIEQKVQFIEQKSVSAEEKVVLELCEQEDTLCDDKTVISDDACLVIMEDNSEIGEIPADNEVGNGEPDVLTLPSVVSESNQENVSHVLPQTEQEDIICEPPNTVDNYGKLMITCDIIGDSKDNTSQAGDHVPPSVSDKTEVDRPQIAQLVLGEPDKQTDKQTSMAVVGPLSDVPCQSIWADSVLPKNESSPAKELSTCLNETPEKNTTSIHVESADEKIQEVMRGEPDEPSCVSHEGQSRGLENGETTAPLTSGKLLEMNTDSSPREDSFIPVGVIEQGLDTAQGRSTEAEVNSSYEESYEQRLSPAQGQDLDSKQDAAGEASALSDLVSQDLHLVTSEGVRSEGEGPEQAATVDSVQQDELQKAGNNYPHVKTDGEKADIVSTGPLTGQIPSQNPTHPSEQILTLNQRMEGTDSECSDSCLDEDRWVGQVEESIAPIADMQAEFAGDFDDSMSANRRIVPADQSERSEMSKESDTTKIDIISRTKTETIVSQSEIVISQQESITEPMIVVTDEPDSMVSPPDSKKTVDDKQSKTGELESISPENNWSFNEQSTTGDCSDILSDDIQIKVPELARLGDIKSQEVAIQSKMADAQIKQVFSEPDPFLDTVEADEAKIQNTKEKRGQILKLTVKGAKALAADKREKKLSKEDVADAVKKLKESSECRAPRPHSYHSDGRRVTKRHYNWNTQHFYPDIMDNDVGIIFSRSRDSSPYGRYVDDEWIKDLQHYQDVEERRSHDSNMADAGDGTEEPMDTTMEDIENIPPYHYTEHVEQKRHASNKKNVDIKAKRQRKDDLHINLDFIDGESSSSEDEQPKQWHKSGQHVRRKKRDERSLSAEICYKQSEETKPQGSPSTHRKEDSPRNRRSPRRLSAPGSTKPSSPRKNSDGGRSPRRNSDLIQEKLQKFEELQKRRKALESTSEESLTSIQKRTEQYYKRKELLKEKFTAEQSFLRKVGLTSLHDSFRQTKPKGAIHYLPIRQISKSQEDVRYDGYDPRGMLVREPSPPKKGKTGTPGKPPRRPSDPTHHTPTHKQKKPKSQFDFHSLSTSQGIPGGQFQTPTADVRKTHKHYQMISSSFENLYDDIDLSMYSPSMYDIDFGRYRQLALEGKLDDPEYKEWVIDVEALLREQYASLKKREDLKHGQTQTGESQTQHEQYDIVKVTSADQASMPPDPTYQPDRAKLREGAPHQRQANSWYVPKAAEDYESKPSKNLDAKSIVEEEKRKFVDYKLEYQRRVSEGASSSGDEKQDREPIAPKRRPVIPPDDYEYILRKIHHQRQDAYYDDATGDGASDSSSLSSPHKPEQEPRSPRSPISPTCHHIRPDLALGDQPDQNVEEQLAKSVSELSRMFEGNASEPQPMPDLIRPPARKPSDSSSKSSQQQPSPLLQSSPPDFLQNKHSSISSSSDVPSFTEDRPRSPKEEHTKSSKPDQYLSSHMYELASDRRRLPGDLPPHLQKARISELQMEMLRKQEEQEMLRQQEQEQRSPPGSPSEELTPREQLNKIAQEQSEAFDIWLKHQEQILRKEGQPDKAHSTKPLEHEGKKQQPQEKPKMEKKYGFTVTLQGTIEKNKGKTSSSLERLPESIEEPEEPKQVEPKRPQQLDLANEKPPKKLPTHRRQPSWDGSELRKLERSLPRDQPHEKQMSLDRAFQVKYFQQQRAEQLDQSQEKTASIPPLRDVQEKWDPNEARREVDPKFPQHPSRPEDRHRPTPKQFDRQIQQELQRQPADWQKAPYDGRDVMQMEPFYGKAPVKGQKPPTDKRGLPGPEQFDQSFEQQFQRPREEYRQSQWKGHEGRPDQYLDRVPPEMRRPPGEHHRDRLPPGEQQDPRRPRQDVMPNMSRFEQRMEEINRAYQKPPSHSETAHDRYPTSGFQVDPMYGSQYRPDPRQSLQSRPDPRQDRLSRSDHRQSPFSRPDTRQSPLSRPDPRQSPQSRPDNRQQYQGRPRDPHSSVEGGRRSESMRQPVLPFPLAPFEQRRSMPNLNNADQMDHAPDAYNIPEYEFTVRLPTDERPYPPYDHMRPHPGPQRLSQPLKPIHIDNQQVPPGYNQKDSVDRKHPMHDTNKRSAPLDSQYNRNNDSSSPSTPGSQRSPRHEKQPNFRDPIDPRHNQRRPDPTRSPKPLKDQYMIHHEKPEKTQPIDWPIGQSTWEGPGRSKPAPGKEIIPPHPSSPKSSGDERSSPTAHRLREDRGPRDSRYQPYPSPQVRHDKGPGDRLQHWPQPQERYSSQPDVRREESGDDRKGDVFRARRRPLPQNLMQTSGENVYEQRENYRNAVYHAPPPDQYPSRHIHPEQYVRDNLRPDPRYSIPSYDVQPNEYPGRRDAGPHLHGPLRPQHPRRSDPQVYRSDPALHLAKVSPPQSHQRTQEFRPSPQLDRAVPVGQSRMPPADSYPNRHSYPTVSQSYPASTKEYPEAIQAYSRPTQAYPEQTYPEPTQGYPGQNTSFPAQTGSYPPETYRSHAEPSHAYTGPTRDNTKSTQAYPESTQAYPETTRGYPGTARGYPEPIHSYPYPAYDTPQSKANAINLLEGSKERSPEKPPRRSTEKPEQTRAMSKIHVAVGENRPMVKSSVDKPVNPKAEIHFPSIKDKVRDYRDATQISSFKTELTSALKKKEGAFKDYEEKVQAKVMKHKESRATAKYEEHVKKSLDRYKATTSSVHESRKPHDQLERMYFSETNHYVDPDIIKLRKSNIQPDASYKSSWHTEKQSSVSKDDSALEIPVADRKKEWDRMSTTSEGLPPKIPKTSSFSVHLQRQKPDPSKLSGFADRLSRSTENISQRVKEEDKVNIGSIKDRLFGPDGEKPGGITFKQELENVWDRQSRRVSSLKDNFSEKDGSLPRYSSYSYGHNMDEDKDEWLYDFVSYKDGKERKKSNIYDPLTELERTYEQLDLENEDIRDGADRREFMNSLGVGDTDSGTVSQLTTEPQTNVKRLSITNVRKLEEIQRQVENPSLEYAKRWLSEGGRSTEDDVFMPSQASPDSAEVAKYTLSKAPSEGGNISVVSSEFRHSKCSIPRKVGDDMAFRKHHKSNSSLPRADVPSSGQSYLSRSRDVTPAPSVVSLSKSGRPSSPDPKYDYQSHRRARSPSIGDTDHGNYPSPTTADYLAPRTSEPIRGRMRTRALKVADPYHDDAAYRKLRKDVNPVVIDIPGSYHLKQTKVKDLNLKTRSSSLERISSGKPEEDHVFLKRSRSLGPAAEPTLIKERKQENLAKGVSKMVSLFQAPLSHSQSAPDLREDETVFSESLCYNSRGDLVSDDPRFKFAVKPKKKETPRSIKQRHEMKSKIRQLKTSADSGLCVESESDSYSSSGPEMHSNRSPPDGVFDSDPDLRVSDGSSDKEIVSSKPPTSVPIHTTSSSFSSMSTSSTTTTAIKTKSMPELKQEIAAARKLFLSAPGPDRTHTPPPGKLDISPRKFGLWVQSDKKPDRSELKLDLSSLQKEESEKESLADIKKKFDAPTEKSQLTQGFPVTQKRQIQVQVVKPAVSGGLSKPDDSPRSTLSTSSMGVHSSLSDSPRDSSPRVSYSKPQSPLAGSPRDTSSRNSQSKPMSPLELSSRDPRTSQAKPQSPDTRKVISLTQSPDTKPRNISQFTKDVVSKEPHKFSSEKSFGQIQQIPGGFSSVMESQTTQKQTEGGNGERKMVVKQIRSERIHSEKKSLVVVPPMRSGLSPRGRELELRGGTRALFSPPFRSPLLSPDRFELSDGEMTDATDITLSGLVEANLARPSSPETLGDFSDYENNMSDAERTSSLTSSGNSQREYLVSPGVTTFTERTMHSQSKTVTVSKHSMAPIGRPEQGEEKALSFKDLVKNFEAQGSPFMRSHLAKDEDKK